MRLIVCGGRTYADVQCVDMTLDWLADVNGPLTVIEGSATGADTLARNWVAKRSGNSVVTEPANWLKYGKAAGPLRNTRMLELHKPEIVVAFPGGRGTMNMIRQAIAAGVPVYHFMIMGDKLVTNRA